MRQEARENYRKTAFVLAQSAKEKGVRSVMFTGASPGAGVTTSAVIVAEQVQSLEGLKTLLVDLNCRRPEIASRLHLDASKTFEDFAASRYPLSECIQQLESGLSVLPARKNSTDELSTVAVQNLLRSVEGTYDLVIFDTPPALGYADSMVIGGAVPHAVIVVEAGRTPYEAIERMKKELEVRKISILGAILNKHRRYIPGWLYGFFAR